MPPSEFGNNGETVPYIEKPFPPPMTRKAFPGIIGEIVDIAEAQCGVSREAVAMGFLVGMGNILGREFVFAQGNNHLNMFAVVVGFSEEGGKGMAWNPSESLLRHIDYEWMNKRRYGSFNSGDGIVVVLRNNRKIPKDRTTLDNRLFIQTEEFSKVLKAINWANNNLEEVLCECWDCKSAINSTNKKDDFFAENPFVSIFGNTTPRALKVYLGILQQENGFGNRFLWPMVRKTRVESFPEDVGWYQHQNVLKHFGEVLEWARKLKEQAPPEGILMGWANDGVRDLWDSFCKSYDKISNVLLARRKPIVLRLASNFAVFEKSLKVGVKHLEAGMEHWRYNVDSIDHNFGDDICITNPKTKAMFWLLQKAPIGPSGSPELSRTALSTGAFRGNQASPVEVQQAFHGLLEAKVARFEMRKGLGRATEMWILTINRR
jgi:hypothetical protein